MQRGKVLLSFLICCHFIMASTESCTRPWNKAPRLGVSTGEGYGSLLGTIPRGQVDLLAVRLRTPAPSKRSTQPTRP